MDPRITAEFIYSITKVGEPWWRYSKGKSKIWGPKSNFPTKLKFAKFLISHNFFIK
jgi:hypothetical protein